METNYIQELLEDLAKANVDFLIAGGVAVVLHGVSRATMDIDAAVSLEHENLVRFLSVMKKHQMVPRVPVPAEDLLDPIKREKMVEEKGALVFTFIDSAKPYKVLDIFLTKELSYSSLKDSVDIFQIGNAQIKVLSREKLIELKGKVQPPRDKDLLDIKELTKLIEAENAKKK